MKKARFYLLSFTWGLPLTLIGCIVALVLIATGHKPKKWGWCWYFETKKSWGFNMGVFFVCGETFTSSLKSHELGHGVQNCIFGVFMPVLAGCSAVRFWYREYRHKIKGVKYSDMPAYDAFWLEGMATRLGEKYVN